MTYNKYPTILKHFYLFLFVIFTSLCGCGNNHKSRAHVNQKTKIKNKTPEIHYIYLVDGIPAGLLRVECADCILRYIVNGLNSTIEVKKGNLDKLIIISKEKSYIKTVLFSNKDQMIRIMLLNPNGMVISNRLDSFKSGDSIKHGYLITYKRYLKEVVIRK